MQKLLNTLWSNTFFRGGVFFTVSSFIANIMNFLFNFIAARNIGPQEYGKLTVLFSYLTVLTVPMVVFSSFIIQKVAGEDNNLKFSKSLENLLLYYLKKWSWLIILIFFLTPLISSFTNLSNFLSFTLISFVLLTIISSVYNSILQGMKLFFIFSVLSVATTFLKLLGAISVALGIDGLFTIIVFLYISNMFGIVYSVKIFHDQVKSRLPALRNAPVIEKKLLSLLKNRQFQLISLSTVSLTIFNNVDVMFVQKFFSPFEVGIYSSWSLFSKIILYALGPFISMSFIFFSSKQSEDTERKTLYLSLTGLLVTGIVSFFVYKYLTFFIINIFYGEKFYAVAPYLVKSSIFGSLYTGVSFISNFFLAKKSKFSAISFFSMFIYIVSLFFIKKDLSSVMNLNIFFSAFLFTIYLVLYIKYFLKPTHSKGSL